MNDRERWIIYPLLFLALGSAVVDKLMPRDATFAMLECEALVVSSDPLQRRRIEINPQGITALAENGSTESVGFRLGANGQLKANQLVTTQLVTAQLVATQGVVAPQVTAQVWHVVDSQGKRLQSLQGKAPQPVVPMPQPAAPTEQPNAEEPPRLPEP